MAEELTEDQIVEKLMTGGTLPGSDEKQNVYTFLHNVALAEDTTKTGNLSQEEVGLPKLPLRTYLELSLFCKEIANMNYAASYFKKKGEILTSTSLSKDAKLLNAATTLKREIADVTKPRKMNTGWFKKKSMSAVEPGQQV